MIKRLLLVLAVIAGIVFVPYWVGKLVERFDHFNTQTRLIDFWLVGLIVCMASTILFIVLFYTIQFIVTGEWD